MAFDDLKPALEALLFSSERPLTLEQIRQAFGQEIAGDDIQKTFELLKEEYESQNRGFRLFEVAGGFQLVSDPRYAEYLKRFFQDRERRKISQASLETLSVIAYKQPVTRAEIEFIRGVNVEGALKTLLEKELIRVTGRKEVPGRPLLYGTTKEFLEHFGLKSIEGLPPLSEFTEKDIAENLLPPELKEEMAEEKEDHASTIEDEK